MRWPTARGQASGDYVTLRSVFRGFTKYGKYRYGEEVLLLSHLD